MTGYTVFLKDPLLPPRAPLDFMAQRLGGTAGAEKFLGENPGFLGRHLTLEAAKTLAEAAAKAGLRTVLAAESDLAVLPPALKPVKITLEGTGFHADVCGVRNFVAYDSVSLITAGTFDSVLPPVTLEPIRKDLLEEVKKLAGMEILRQTLPATKETFFRAEVIAQAAALRLVLEAENLDYSGLGKERTYSSFLNFRKLLEILSGSSIKALRNPFLEAFLSGKPLARLKLASEQACETDTARLLLLAPRL